MINREKKEKKKQLKLKLIGGLLVFLMAASLVAIMANQSPVENANGPVSEPILYGFEEPTLQNIDFRINSSTPIVIHCDKEGNKTCKNVSILNTTFYDASVLVVYDDNTTIENQEFQAWTVYDYYKENNTYQQTPRERVS